MMAFVLIRVRIVIVAAMAKEFAWSSCIPRAWSRLIKSQVNKGLAQAEAGSLGGRGNKAIDNIKSFGGTAATYTLKRLKRDMVICSGG